MGRGTVLPAYLGRHYFMEEAEGDPSMTAEPGGISVGMQVMLIMATFVAAVVAGVFYLKYQAEKEGFVSKGDRKLGAKQLLRQKRKDAKKQQKTGRMAQG